MSGTEQINSLRTLFQHTVGERMNVRYKSEVGTAADLMEKCHASNQAEEGWFVVRVSDANCDQEDTSGNPDKMYPKFLDPERMCVFVEDVANETTRGPSEHGCSPAAASLTELREVLEIVGTEDRVDGEFTTK
jgi:hypothetical protein